MTGKPRCRIPGCPHQPISVPVPFCHRHWGDAPEDLILRFEEARAEGGMEYVAAREALIAWWREPA